MNQEPKIEQPANVTDMLTTITGSVNQIEAAAFATVVMYTSFSMDLRESEITEADLDILTHLRNCRDHIVTEYKLPIAMATVIVAVASQAALDFIRMPSGIFTENAKFNPISYRYIKDTFDALKTTYGRVIVAKILSSLTMNNAIQKNPTLPHYIISSTTLFNARSAASQDVYMTCGHIVDSIVAVISVDNEELREIQMDSYAPEIKAAVRNRIKQLSEMTQYFAEDEL